MRECKQTERESRGCKGENEQRPVWAGGPVPDLGHQAMRMEFLPCARAVVRMSGEDSMRDVFSVFRGRR